jgi:dihydropteroate synthase
VQILGILNLTRDSFSDGGLYLDPDTAIAHARQLVAHGADFVDVGAESTNPDGESVTADEEIRRLEPVVAALVHERVAVSIDTYKPSVMHAMIALGAAMINDVTALGDPAAVAAVRGAACRIILMHSTSSGARAERRDVTAETIMDRVLRHFEERIAALTAQGIARERLILDPGMGFFLGRDPRVSLNVLRNLDRLRSLDLPLCVSTSRKSFIGTVLGSGPAADGRPRPVEQRGAGTLATELWALAHGVEYVRTHDVRSLSDAARVWRAIEQA